jgi:hypothetical protein
MFICKTMHDSVKYVTDDLETAFTIFVLIISIMYIQSDLILVVKKKKIIVIKKLIDYHSVIWTGLVFILRNASKMLAKVIQF